MSVVTLPLYRETSGTMHNPAVNIVSQDTNYLLNGVSTPRTLKEVFLTWSGTDWSEDATFNTGDIVATKITNPSNGQYVYTSMKLPDVRAIQICCIS